MKHEALVCCRSVVVAVRGTATMEDVITDSVAAPDLLDRSEWLPESFKQQQAQTGLQLGLMHVLLPQAHGLEPCGNQSHACGVMAGRRP